MKINRVPKSNLFVLEIIRICFEMKLSRIPFLRIELTFSTNADNCSKVVALDSSLGTSIMSIEFGICEGLECDCWRETIDWNQVWLRFLNTDTFEIIA
jgi:hypothetical protein